ncbi:MAG: AAA family ATPase [Thermoguttaceae bacterium]|jgi:hypothetical protein
MIHRIRIQNFKSLRDVTVEFSPVTVLIGKSGTGKTNLASAIGFLRDYLRAGAGGGNLQQQLLACRCATNPSGAIEFQVVFDIPGFTLPFSYTLAFHPQHNIAVPRLESLEYGGEALFRQTFAPPSNQVKWEVEPAILPLPQPGPIALGRLPGIEDAVMAYTVLTTAIGIYRFPYDVLKGQPSGHQGTGLADDGGNYLEAMRQITSSLNPETRRSITASLRRINPTIAGVDLDSVQNPRRAVVAHHWDGKRLQLDLSQESDGFRRFYAHLLAVYQTPPKQTLLFEEPENGIYPGALSLLAEEFQAAPGAGRGQIILTTHSPALLDHFLSEQIRVVELVDLETKVGPLAEEQRESLADELLHAGELLTVDPARGAAP